MWFWDLLGNILGFFLIKVPIFLICLFILFYVFGHLFVGIRWICKKIKNLIFNLYYICRDKLKKIKYKKKADIIADKIIFGIKFGWKWLNYIFIFGFFGLIIFYCLGTLVGIK